MSLVADTSSVVASTVSVTGKGLGASFSFLRTQPLRFIPPAYRCAPPSQRYAPGGFAGPAVLSSAGPATLLLGGSL